MQKLGLGGRPSGTYWESHAKEAMAPAVVHEHQACDVFGWARPQHPLVHVRDWSKAELVKQLHPLVMCVDWCK